MLVLLLFIFATFVGAPMYFLYETKHIENTMANNVSKDREVKKEIEGIY